MPCPTPSPGIKCTHHRGADTWRRAICSRASVLQGSGERCEDKGSQWSCFRLRKNMCVYGERDGILASRLLHLLFLLSISQQGCYCWTNFLLDHLHCLWLSCALQDIGFPWFHQPITSSSVPFLVASHLVILTNKLTPTQLQMDPCGLRCSLSSFSQNSPHILQVFAQVILTL